jgi:hypothetical protein
MPRTAVNLPDPMQSTAQGELNNADDLLSQLAGEELDRLLSEADSAPPDASGFDLTDENGVDAGEASLNQLFNELDDSDLPTLAEDHSTPVSPPPTPFNTGAVVTKETSPAVPAPVPAPTTTAPIAPPARKIEAPASAADDLAAEMEADEAAHAAALRRMKEGSPAPAAQPFPVVTAKATPAPDVSTDLPPTPAPADEPTTIVDDLSAFPASDPPSDEDSTPFVVRLLEWINAPLAGLSENLRQAMGKVALITTLNAIGVFVYVLFFRRH